MTQTVFYFCDDYYSAAGSSNQTIYLYRQLVDFSPVVSFRCLSMIRLANFRIEWRRVRDKIISKNTYAMKAYRRNSMPTRTIARPMCKVNAQYKKMIEIKR